MDWKADFDPGVPKGQYDLYPKGKNLSAHQFWGKGVPHMFPEGTGEIRGVPWDRASRTKSHEDYDKGRVQDALRSPPQLSEVDPVQLRATQPSVTRGGVEYYAGSNYSETGETFADKGNVGNRFPVVYERDPIRPGADTEKILLSGHHRASAALAAGQPLRAIVVKGPQGPPRNR